MEEEKKKELEFNTYNGMGRTATYMGIPQFVLLGMFFFTPFFVGVCYAIFGFWGLLSVLIPAALLLIIRALCEADSRFLLRLWWMVKRLWRNRKYGRGVLISPANPKWESFYGRYLTQKRITVRKSYTDDEISR
jgi:type IV secretory pathway VirB3-like protein